MRDTLRHRGPDDSGVWVDAVGGIGLGHRRLSIVDLSAAGHQPMVSQSGRFVVAYNGEIYNFVDLRNQLTGRGCAFRGHSDTEVLLAAVETWGVPGALERFNGMFAFALWDRHDRALYLARDRFGEKPLYYGRSETTLLFASELKALRAFPTFGNEVDRDAVTQLLRLTYIPAPKTIYRGVHKLLPATWLRVLDPADIDKPPTPYWSLRSVAEAGVRARFRGSEQDAVEELDSLLRRSVKMRMVADVPLGAFLSGGIDSSTVVALMQAQSARPVKTFTIGFAEEAYNEARAAKAVAQHLGTDHTELYVTPEQAQEVIPKLHELYDEPFADSSQIPTFLVSQLARRDVTVALSGDGGDELFGGYTRYAWAQKIWTAIRPISPSVRAAAARGLVKLSPASWDRIFRLGDRLIPPSLRVRLPGDKVHLLAELLALRTAPDLYFHLLSNWKSAEEVVLGGTEPRPRVRDLTRELQADFTEQMMFADTLTYLPDDILVKVDRAAMGVSLETRVPILDPEVAAFAWRLPLRYKTRRARGKVALRRVLHRYVPPELVERPKMGFGVPVDLWLRGSLRPWAEELLNPRRLEQQGLFEPHILQRKWHEHLSGERNWMPRLWPILMFEAWMNAPTSSRVEPTRTEAYPSRGSPESRT
jgi:asparagine synthase (glutamine-hydrolysing)